jgi:hypothetical protein
MCEADGEPGADGGTPMPAMPSRNMRMKVATAFVDSGTGSTMMTIVPPVVKVVSGRFSANRPARLVPMIAPAPLEGAGPRPRGGPSGAVLTAVVEIGAK